jgi:enediyne biosynthesis protein E4
MNSQKYMQSMKSKAILYTVALLILGCNKAHEGTVFRKKSADETSIRFQNSLTETDDLNILDYLYFYNGGGVAVGDINNDGLPDLYFSANQGPNKLYLNKGNLTFEDITETAGVAGKSSWNTGTVMVDINADGLLDIYVCAVVGLNGFNGHNELFINQGDGTFTESASSYGLDFESYSSNAAFLDYDQDGDLDMYLLNHAVHTPQSYGNAALRNERTYETGDKLLRNDNGVFVDVSKEAGIYGGINGYGLGISIADFNQDGYPDIFVGNDFHEDDYYYLNNGDGTFTESLRQYFGHTSRFSMGSDAADLNHDGFPDLISLDMLPDDEKVLKASEGDDNIQIQKLRIGTYGYHYQFTRNMLFINQPGAPFMETALQSGVAATDWSWSALFADFDQDGEQDLFIGNGIPKRPNDLDYINFVSNDNVKRKINNTNLVDQKAIELMPSGFVANRMFQGGPNLVFKDRSKTWIPQDTLISGAIAFADLDNDGDLDLIANNLNNTASIYENKTNEKASYLKIYLMGPAQNPQGIGTKVFAYTKGQMQYKELYTVRGFQASSEPVIHFGFGQSTHLDSLKVIWPNKQFQILKNVALNQTLHLGPQNTTKFDHASLKPKTKRFFEKIEGQLGIGYVHKEDNYTDFNRQKLIPYQVSDRGPATSVADLDGDGKEDVFFGSSKYFPSKIYLQKEGRFLERTYTSIAKDSIKEDVVSAMADFNGDGKTDLVVGTGGADFYGQMQPLTDGYFANVDSLFVAQDFPELFQNTSVLVPFDFDGDGDLDLFVGSQSISGDFGKAPDAFLLENVGGRFTIVPGHPLRPWEW